MLLSIHTKKDLFIVKCFINAVLTKFILITSVFCLDKLLKAQSNLSKGIDMKTGRGEVIEPIYRVYL